MGQGYSGLGPVVENGAIVKRELASRDAVPHGLQASQAPGHQLGVNPPHPPAVRAGFFGCNNVIELARVASDEVRRGLRIQVLGNELMELFGACYASRRKRSTIISLNVMNRIPPRCSAAITAGPSGRAAGAPESEPRGSKSCWPKAVCCCPAATCFTVWWRAPSKSCWRCTKRCVCSTPTAYRTRPGCRSACASCRRPARTWVESRQTCGCRCSTSGSTTRMTYCACIAKKPSASMTPAFPAPPIFCA